MKICRPKIFCNRLHSPTVHSDRATQCVWCRAEDEILARTNENHHVSLSFPSREPREIPLLLPFIRTRWNSSSRPFHRVWGGIGSGLELRLGLSRVWWWSLLPFPSWEGCLRESPFPFSSISMEAEMANDKIFPTPPPLSCFYPHDGDGEENSLFLTEYGNRQGSCCKQHNYLGHRRSLRVMCGKGFFELWEELHLGFFKLFSADI